MKRGFALLETIVVITFLSVSLLLLYGTFSNMISNSKRNLLYDDASNIYKVYYIKEYLGLDNFKVNGDIEEIDCDGLVSGCNKLLDSFEVENMYITYYDLKNYDSDLYSSSFNNYVDSLSNKGDYNYRLIVEFSDSSYASIGLVGGNYE